MIQKADLDEIESGFNALGNLLIGLGWLCHATWMIVCAKQSCGVLGERKFDNFARMHARRIDCTAEKLDIFDKPMACIE